MDFSQARINGRLRENHPKKGDVKGQTSSARSSLVAPVRHELFHQAGDGGFGAVLGEVPHRELERERYPRRGARPDSSSCREESNSSSSFPRAFTDPRRAGPRPPSLTHPFYRTISAGSPQGLHSQEGGRDAQDGQVQQAHGDRAPAGTSRPVSRPTHERYFPFAAHPATQPPNHSPNTPSTAG